MTGHSEAGLTHARSLSLLVSIQEVSTSLVNSLRVDITAAGFSPFGSYMAGNPRAARLCSAVELWDSAAELVRCMEDWRRKDVACWSRGRGLLDMPCRHKSKSKY